MIITFMLWPKNFSNKKDKNSILPKALIYLVKLIQKLKCTVEYMNNCLLFLKHILL